jgi:allantoin racemase
MSCELIFPVEENLNMPKALIINPNTTRSMTEDIAISASKVFSSPWDFHAVQPPGGTGSIESWFEVGLASTAILAILREYDSVDGVVIACFGDPGLYALREILSVPVVGIAEASFLTACMIGNKFGVILGGHSDIPAIENLLWMFGLEKRHAGSWAMDMEVLDMNVDYKKTLHILIEGSKSIIKNGAEVILLGCAGLSPFQDELQERIGAPVINPVEAGCRQLRSIVEMGLNTSRIGMYAGPNPKQLENLKSIFEPGLAKWLENEAKSGFNKTEE